MVNLRRFGVVVAVSCCTALASCARSESLPDTPRPRIHTVTMEGMVFRPAVIAVRPGDTIVWVNKDLVPHTATSSQAGFDSKLIPANDSWRHRVEKPGDFDYVCSFHPTMTGKLSVRE
jgi:plastocyanin